MIVSPRFPYLEIQVTVRGQKVQNWAYIDTGFDGYVVMPHQQVQVLGPGDYVSLWELGDASLAPADEYLGQVRLAACRRGHLRVNTATIYSAMIAASYYMWH